MRGRLHDEEMAGQAQQARLSEAQELTSEAQEVTSDLKRQVRQLQSQVVSMDRCVCTSVFPGSTL